MRESKLAEVAVLDDLTIAGRVEGLDGIPMGMMQLGGPPGTPRRWGTSRARGIFVSVSETGVVSMRLSVPRWMHGHPVNYPLVPITGVEQLGLRRLGQELAGALGLRVSAIGGEIERRFPLQRWPVIRVSYAVDLRVTDPLKTVQGCLGIHRKYTARVDAHGSPQISTVAWHTRSLSSKFYAKGMELETHRRAADDDGRDEIERLASAADHDLRFETTFKQVRALRALFHRSRIGNRLPTLALMCDPRVDGWVLTREADRLRLLDEHEGRERTTFASHVRHVVGVLLEAQARLTAGERTMNRRQSMTKDRFVSLIHAYVLGAAYSVSEVADMTGKSVSSVREQTADLRCLGIPPDASPFATMGVALREIAEGLSPHLLDQLPPDLADWDAREPFARPPWLDEDEVDEDQHPADTVDDPIDDVDDVLDLGFDLEAV